MCFFRPVCLLPVQNTSLGGFCRRSYTFRKQFFLENFAYNSSFVKLYVYNGKLHGQFEIMTLTLTVNSGIAYATRT
jgi:hypothetical protein